MNERIKELVIQATEYAHTKNYSLHQFNLDALYEKFAELIINECAVIADMGWAAPGTQIKQHFGVEQ